MTRKLGGLARVLLNEGLMSQDEADAIHTLASKENTPFVTQLIQSKKISAMKIAEVAANAFGFPLFDLNALNADYLPEKPIDSKLMKSNRVLALRSRGNVLHIAISDPTNLNALDDVQFQSGMTLSPVVVEDDKLGKWIDKLSAANDSNAQSITDIDDFGLDEVSVGEIQEAEPGAGN